MKHSLLFIPLLMLFATSCARNPSPPHAKVRHMDATVKIAEAADAVSKSLEDLARVQETTMPPSATAKPLPDAGTAGMQGLASVDWTGPIEPLITKIANATHYRFRKLGRPPAVPIIATISARNTTLANILRDIDFQAGEKATIVVYPQTRVIELRYAKA